jgi:hypothetical protein
MLPDFFPYIACLFEYQFIHLQISFQVYGDNLQKTEKKIAGIAQKIPCAGDCPALFYCRTLHPKPFFGGANTPFCTKKHIKTVKNEYIKPYQTNHIPAVLCQPYGVRAKRKNAIQDCHLHPFQR